MSVCPMINYPAKGNHIGSAVSESRRYRQTDRLTYIKTEKDPVTLV